MYISGLPGTGKTATTLEVIKKLEKMKKNYNFIHINAMTMVNTNNIYSILYKQITGMKAVSFYSALIFLENYFKTANKT